MLHERDNLFTFNDDVASFAEENVLYLNVIVLFVEEVQKTTQNPETSFQSLHLKVDKLSQIRK